jgi:hypothetical protein
MTIPASQIVSVNPNVLSAGGTALAIVGLMLTQNTRVPIGTVQQFPSPLAVQQALGAGSVDAAAATIYFNGYTGSSQKPGQILVAQYNTTAVSAYLRGASLASVSLTALQAFNGPISVAIDGYLRSASVNLSSAVSFSGAAASIQSALNAGLSTVATYTASIAGTTLSVSGTLSGTLSVGQTVTGSNTAANSIILAQLTGLTGGTGTYQLSQATGTVTSQTLSSTPTSLLVSFDSVTSAFVIQSQLTGTLSTSAYASGSLATSLTLTQATGAVLSQGAAAATPATFMNNVIRQTTNWATFFLNFDVDNGVGNTNKQAFGLWTSGQNNRYAYLAGDADVTPTLSIPASTSLGVIAENNEWSGVCAIYDPLVYPTPAFIAGAAASINFNATNGRITFALKSQTGFTPTVTDPVVSQNLLGNSYSFYGAYATASQGFQFFYNGAVAGPFEWLDSFINQIWLNAALQQAILTYMTSVGSIPYNRTGYTAIANSVASVIQQGLTFGAFSAGVTLSSAEIQAANTQAGANIGQTLQTQGWFLQISDPGAQARAARQTPIANFWYVDGQSVQQITLGSIAAS